MKINNLLLERKFLDITESNDWKNYDKSILTQLLGVDATYFMLYSIDTMAFETNGFVQILKSEPDSCYWGTKDSNTSPGQIANADIVLFGDTEPDSCLALYFEHPNQSPKVILLTENDDDAPVWKEIAKTFDEFHEKVSSMGK